MSITSIISDVVEAMCNDYCKYADEALQALEEKDTTEGTHCDHCPLMEL